MVDRRRRPAWQAPLRSMGWLRAAGLAYRVRAFVLLVSFAVGSLLARDALLVQQLLQRCAEMSLGEVASDDAPSVEERAAGKHFKVRPSGLSRRVAMNPWDPPDDNDDLDEDSDTVAADFATVAVLPAAADGPRSSPFVTREGAPASSPTSLSNEHRHGIWSRGPPV